MFQFTTLENLTLYKSLMDADTQRKIDAAVSPAIKTVSQSADGYTIFFYTKEAPVTEGEAAFSIHLPSPVNITGKADKVTGAIAGNFAGLDANGNLTDSGKKATDFDAAGAASDVQTSLLNFIGTIPPESDAKTVIDYLKQFSSSGIYDDSELRGLINGLQTEIDKLNGTGEGSIDKAIADAKAELEAKIGDLTTLNTTNKGSLVVAINELFDRIGSIESANKVTIESTDTTDGMLKSYTVKQGTNTIGVIDIPKDMVVKSGQVVKDPAGHPAGTYIELTLANATTDKLYINVGTLVDIYTAEASATKVQLTINPSTRVISATIVAESITSTELAADAVTTVKIVDDNVTLAKLAADVKSAFEPAGTVKALEDGQVKTNTDNIATNTAGIAQNAADILELQTTLGEGFEAIPDEDIISLFTTT